MSIESKHAYRFGFLKSERWQNLRLQRLAMDDAYCFICETRNLSNDAHHILYRSNWNETKVEDLRTLCRGCHGLAHEIMKERPEFSWKQIKTRINPVSIPRQMTGSDYMMIHLEAHKKQIQDKKYLTVFFAYVMHLQALNRALAYRLAKSAD